MHFIHIPAVVKSVGWTAYQQILQGKILKLIGQYGDSELSEEIYLYIERTYMYSYKVCILPVVLPAISSLPPDTD